ncbi:MAG: ABC-2 transporter permease, partial [Lachnospiraceae bacterium]|nr:ABC-2 transporter permease [Lachnospiraceae bacterium]
MGNISDKLFRKEVRLAQSILTPVFLVGTAMTLIPNYPVLIGCFWVCLGIFYSFQNMREQNDILYSILLPIAKRDIVSAKYRFVCFYEGLAFL